MVDVQVLSSYPIDQQRIGFEVKVEEYNWLFTQYVSDGFICQCGGSFVEESEFNRLVEKAKVAIREYVSNKTNH